MSFYFLGGDFFTLCLYMYKKKMRNVALAASWNKVYKTSLRFLYLILFQVMFVLFQVMKFYGLVIVNDDKPDSE